ncbi:MAG: hypothetical protein OHK0023_20640 [Anaerolineae bacterium]
MDEHMLAVNQVFADAQSNMSQIAVDYGNWTELHNQTTLDEPDLVWIAENLAETVPASPINSYGLEVLGLVNADGDLIFAFGPAQQIYQSQGALIAQALRAAEPIIQYQVIDESVYLLGFGAVLLSDGTNPSGVLIIGRRIGTTDAERIRTLTGVEVAIYSGETRLAATAGQTLPLDSAALRSAASRQAVFDQSQPDFALAYEPLLNSVPLVVVLQKSRTALNLAQRSILNSLVLWLVISVAASVVVALLLTRHIAHPLLQMVERADQIAKGNYSQRMTLPKAKDELHRLASAMNQMTERLVKTIQTEQENARALDEQAKALILANAKANEAIRTERDFIATMSHELRTPLNAIIGYSDLMLMATDLSLKERTRIESIRNSGSRLLYLINELLDMSKIESGRLDLRIAPFSPTQLAQRLTTQLSILAETRNLAFQMEVDPTLPEQVLGDEGRIEQIITNLLGNAFKFTETGSVVLTIRAHQPDQQWSISVTDTGAGIPPEAQSIIFEKYRRLEMEALSDKPGTGLGLPITRNLVELMGGVITLESQPGKGSTFTVRLPMIIAKAAAEATEAQST